MKAVKLVMQSPPISTTCADNNDETLSLSQISSFNEMKIQGKHATEQRKNRNSTRVRHSTPPPLPVPKALPRTSSSSYFKNNSDSNNDLAKGQMLEKKKIIQIMLKKEQAKYRCVDYFHTFQPKSILIHEKQQEAETRQDDDQMVIGSSRSLSSMSAITESTKLTTTTLFSSSTSTQGKRRLVDVACRDKICEWAYRIMNYFNVERETVYYAISYLDRFMAYYKADRYTYKLLATTSLFLALKVHQSRKLILKNVVKDLSKGEFDMDDVNQMELIMLRVLSWSLHPPTPMAYVAHIVDMHQPMIIALNQHFELLSSGKGQDDNDDDLLFFDTPKVEAFAIFFVELSVFDYDFVPQRQSRIALAAILNTLEGLGLFQRVSSLKLTSSTTSKKATNQMKCLFYKLVLSMFDAVQINAENLEGGDQVSNLREKLWDLYEKSEEHTNMSLSSSTFFGRRGGHHLNNGNNFLSGESYNISLGSTSSPRSISDVGSKKRAETI
jgi:hypothetical protein